MDAVIISLLPLVLGGFVGAPAWIIMTLILLRGEGGVSKATALAAGGTTVRLIQFVLFGYTFGLTLEGSGDKAFELVRSTLLLLVGLLLLITGIKNWSKGNDPDAPPPTWMKRIGGMSARAAFGMAALIIVCDVKQWVITLSAIAIIDAAHLGTAGSILAYIFFVVAVQSLMLAPILGRAIAPRRSTKVIEVALQYLERKNRVITIAVALIFGAWFFTKGISGLVHDVPVPIGELSATIRSSR